MSRRERVAGRAQAYRHVVALAGNERRGMLVALAMREVEHAGRDEGRLAGRRDVAETDGDEGRRTVSRDGQAGFRKAENLDPLLERSRVEAEREPVVQPLVRRQIRGIAVRAPEARVEPAELRAAQVEPAIRAGRLRERALAESKDPNGHSGAGPRLLGHPASGALLVVSSTRNRFLQPGTKQRLRVDARVDALQPAVPPPQTLLEESDRRPGHTVVRECVSPRAYEPLARAG